MYLKLTVMEYDFKFKNILEMLTKLPDEKSCIEYLEYTRWNGKPKCPCCNGDKHYKLKVKGEFNGMYKCASCHQRYTVRVGTIFESSNISLQKWLYTIFIFTSHKKGISSHQLAKDISVTQKTAWFMLQRIRYALEDRELTVRFSSQVSCDESFVGGKNKNRHKDKKVPMSQGRSYKDKTPVFGMMCEGKIVTVVIPNTKARTIQPIIKKLLEKGSTLVSDEWLGYSGLEKDYNHIIVNHMLKQYSNKGYSTNNVENFWSHLKRGIYGVYHQTSPKHLHLYTSEFSYRFNTREMEEVNRFESALINSYGSRLRYKELIRA